MRNFRILTLIFLVFAAFATPSCSKKSGCPATESLKPKTNKKGEVVASKKKHQDGLFPKKMKKRMK